MTDRNGLKYTHTQTQIAAHGQHRSGREIKSYPERRSQRGKRKERRQKRGMKDGEVKRQAEELVECNR